MKIYLHLFILGSITSLIFPPFFFTPLGFVVIPYLYFKITSYSKNTSNIKSFNEGFVYGFGLNLFLFFWLKNPFFIEEETSNLFFLSYLYIIYVSLYYGLLFLLLRFFKNLNIQLIIFPVLFVILEIIRSKLFISFPWNLFGYVFSNHVFLFQITKFIGTYGLSFIVINIFIIPIILLNIINNKNTRFSKFYLFCNLITLVILYFVSSINSPIKNKQNQYNLDIIIYQNNTPQNEKWDKNMTKKRFTNLITFIEKNSNNINPTVLIFSETEIPFILEEDDQLLKFIQSKLKTNTSIIIGGIRKKTKEKEYYNSMYSINTKKINYFDKKILVPFGEYIPFKNIFPYIKKFTQGREDFSSGKKIRSINLINNINIIPTICYESIFFENIITDKNINNDIIINITNDSWFGKFSGPYQHFYQARVRSPEFGKYQIRVSNNGISAVIDPKGKILASTELDEKAVLKYTLKVKNIDKFYFKQKYIIIYLFLTVFLIVCIFYERKFSNNK